MICPHCRADVPELAAHYGVCRVLDRVFGKAAIRGVSVADYRLNGDEW